MTAGKKMAMRREVQDRPAPARLESSRLAMANIDSELTNTLQNISALSPPQGMDPGLWSLAKIAMEEEARKEAERKKLPFKAVVKLEELHQIYDSLGTNNKKSGLDFNVQNHDSSSERQTRDPTENADMKIKEAFRVSMQESSQTSLDLSGLFLSTLPKSMIVKLSSTLIKLDISNNNFQIFPEAVCDLVNLQFLDVHSNEITELPDSIGQLDKLKHLNVAGNCLASLPDAIEGCRALEELIADFNRLIFLPDALGFELLKLRKLSVHSNKLRHLPYSTSHMMCLRYLDVHLNRLMHLPEDLENLTHLEHLNLSKNFNYLTSLPDSLGSLFSLLELDISYNQISSLPKTIPNLHNLHHLKVEGNPLVDPPAYVVGRGVESIMRYMRDKYRTQTAHQTATPLRRSWLGSLTPARWIAYATPNRRISKSNNERNFFGHEYQQFAEEKDYDSTQMLFPHKATKHSKGFLYSPLRLFSQRSSPCRLALRVFATPRRNPHHSYSPRGI